MLLASCIPGSIYFNLGLHIADMVESSPPLVVFDFDWSFVNENTDTYVIEKLTPDLHAAMNSRSLPWTQLMDAVSQSLMVYWLSS